MNRSVPLPFALDLTSLDQAQKNPAGTKETETGRKEAREVLSPSAYIHLRGGSTRNTWNPTESRAEDGRLEEPTLTAPSDLELIG